MDRRGITTRTTNVRAASIVRPHESFWTNRYQLMRIHQTRPRFVPMAVDEHVLPVVPPAMAAFSTLVRWVLVPVVSRQRHQRPP